MKIKQFLLLFPIFGILMSCNSANKIIVNRKVIDTQGEAMLVGRTTESALTAPEFNDWYSNEYSAYIPNQDIIKKLKGRTRLYRIEIFFGTWCSDSHEQLPRFLKILNETKFPQNKLLMYGVNRKKESFYGEQAQKAIHKIPTFIIYKRDIEIGRIIETPTETLEADLYKIITKKEFSNVKKEPDSVKKTKVKSKMKTRWNMGKNKK